jgi:hypothetical protein
MVVFEEVLGEVEERSRRFEHARPSPGLQFIGTLAFVPSQPCVAAGRVAAAYRREQSSRPAADVQPPPVKPEKVTEPTTAPGLSRERLKALRRSAAWRLHPDRWPSEGPRATQSLARINAAIDAALERCRD